MPHTNSHNNPSPLIPEITAGCVTDVTNSPVTDICYGPFGYIYPAGARYDFASAISPQEIFGARSELLTTIPVAEPTQNARVTGVDAVIDLMFPAIFFIYLYSIYRFRGLAGRLLEIIAGGRKADGIAEESGQPFKVFVNVMCGIGLLSLTTLILKQISLHDGELPASGNLREWAIPLLVPAALILISIYRWTVDIIVAAVSSNRGFVQSIRFFDRVVFAAFSLLATPLLVASASWNTATNGIFSTLWTIVLIIFALYYVIKSFNFFAGKGASTLEFFMYLCAVKILPASFYLLLASWYL